MNKILLSVLTLCYSIGIHATFNVESSISDQSKKSLCALHHIQSTSATRINASPLSCEHLQLLANIALISFYGADYEQAIQHQTYETVVMALKVREATLNHEEYSQACTVLNEKIHALKTLLECRDSITQLHDTLFELLNQSDFEPVSELVHAMINQITELMQISTYEEKEIINESLADSKKHLMHAVSALAMIANVQQALIDEAMPMEQEEKNKEIAKLDCAHNLFQTIDQHVRTILEASVIPEQCAKKFQDLGKIIFLLYYKAALDCLKEKQADQHYFKFLFLDNPQGFLSTTALLPDLDIISPLSR